MFKEIYINFYSTNISTKSKKVLCKSDKGEDPSLVIGHG